MAEERSFEAAMRICSAKRSAAELSALMPFRPSRVIDRGSKLNGGKARDSRWILDSPLPSQSSIEEHIAYFLGLLEANSAKLGQLPNDCEADIWCTIASPGEFAGFALDRTLLRRLADKRLDLIFSVYTEGEKPKNLRKR